MISRPSNAVSDIIFDDHTASIMGNTMSSITYPNMLNWIFRVSKEQLCISRLLAAVGSLTLAYEL